MATANRAPARIARTGWPARLRTWSGRLRRQPVFLWVSNAGALEMTANSIASLRRAGAAGPRRSILAVADLATADAARRLGIEARILCLARIDRWRRLDLEIGAAYSDFDTLDFRKVCLARYFALDHILRRERRPVVYADGDVVFLRDPCAYLHDVQCVHGSPVLVQNDRRADHNSHEWSADYPAGARPAGSVICAGFQVWSPLREHRELIEAIIHASLAEPLIPSDQQIFNRLGDSLLARVKLLRQDLFPNGSLCFKNRYLPSQPIDAPDFDWSDAFTVHANWMVGLATKIAALRDARLWFV
jgi:hypothetical protein